MKLFEKEGSVRFEVRAKPRAKKSRVVRGHGDTVEIALAAPPVDGAANEELLRYLAEVLGIAKRDVMLVRGETSRTKLVAVRSLSAEEVRRRLGESMV